VIVGITYGILIGFASTSTSDEATEWVATGAGIALVIADIVVIVGLIGAVGHYLVGTKLQDTAMSAAGKTNGSDVPAVEPSDTAAVEETDPTPPVMRRIRDLAPGDRLVEDDGTVVTVLSVPDTFGAQFSVPVRVPSGNQGIRRWPSSAGDELVQLAPPDE
jgi:hypothetical protein